MTGFILGTVSIFITLLVLVGFIGIGAVMAFEFGAVFLFWVKDAWINSRKTLPAR